MAGFSDYLKNALVNASLRNTAYTSVTPIYIALFATNPNTGGIEVIGGSYVRKAITFVSPTVGVTSNAGVVNFPVSTGIWGSITYFGIMDALTAGHLLYFGELTTHRNLIVGDSVSVPIGNIIITLI
jgi:hypothetical protein